MIDTQRLDSLKSEIGTEGICLLAGVFLDEADQILDELVAKRANLTAGLHALHGSALNLGLRELATLCAQAQKDAQIANPPEVDLATIKTTYERSRAAFMAALDQS